MKRGSDGPKDQRAQGEENPQAALVPMAQLKAWQERRVRFFNTLDEVGKKTKDAKPEVIEREVAAAVKAVRARARRRKR